MNSTSELFRLLGDPLRLRVLRLLHAEKLNVSELTSILGVAQSGVSRHLRLLREAGLLSEAREGGWAYYAVDPSQFSEAVGRMWPMLAEQLKTLEGCRQDDARLQEVLRQRQEDFRDRRKVTRGICPGRSWAAWSRTLGYLIPPVTVADLGCGEGYLALEVARWARKVIAVDYSGQMLKHSRLLARRHGVSNILLKRGKLEKLPIQDRSVDVALLSQVLHCVLEPVVVLREAFRILKPGGRLLLQELRTHQEEWVRERLGDVWLGFDEKQLKALLGQVGFHDVRLSLGASRRGDPFTVIVGTAAKLTAKNAKGKVIRR